MLEWLKREWGTTIACAVAISWGVWLGLEGDPISFLMVFYPIIHVVLAMRRPPQERPAFTLSWKSLAGQDIISLMPGWVLVVVIALIVPGLYLALGIIGPLK